VTILGGQLLGSNPDLGKALLYTGGAIGITGTVILVKGFNKISIGPLGNLKIMTNDLRLRWSDI